MKSAWCPSAEKRKTPLQHASVVCDGEPGRTNPELSGFSPCKSAMPGQATTHSSHPGTILTKAVDRFVDGLDMSRLVYDVYGEMM